MGAATFIVSSTGSSAADAFREAVTHARWEFGHGGYTGTIAEKQSFVVIPLPNGVDARQYATQLLDADDPRISDKWGPAGCVALGQGGYLFFGWASS